MLTESFHPLRSRYSYLYNLKNVTLSTFPTENQLYHNHLSEKFCFYSQSNPANRLPTLTSSYKNSVCIIPTHINIFLLRFSSEACLNTFTATSRSKDLHSSLTQCYIAEMNSYKISKNEKEICQMI